MKKRLIIASLIIFLTILAVIVFMIHSRAERYNQTKSLCEIKRDFNINENIQSEDFFLKSYEDGKIIIAEKINMKLKANVCIFDMNKQKVDDKRLVNISKEIEVNEKDMNGDGRSDLILLSDINYDINRIYNIWLNDNGSYKFLEDALKYPDLRLIGDNLYTSESITGPARGGYQYFELRLENFKLIPIKQISREVTLKPDSLNPSYKYLLFEIGGTGSLEEVDSFESEEIIDIEEVKDMFS